MRAVEGYDKGVLRRRREVLLGNEPPRFEGDARFEPTRPLNPEQLEAVALALSADDFALVHGPPGTGKSHVLAEVAVQSVRRGARVLCTAASNAAVDHLLELCLEAGLDAVRVGHPARVLPRLTEHTLDVKVEAHPDRVPPARCSTRPSTCSATRAGSARRAAAASASPTPARPRPRRAG